MKYFLPIFILLNYFSLAGQERLTSIVNEVQEEKIYVQEIDGETYVLKTNPQDELKVFLLEDDYELVHLHTNTFNNVHIDFFVRVIDEHVYLIDGIQPVKYNFVLNNEIRYTIPEGWFPLFWNNAGTRLPSVNTRDASNSNSKSYFLGENGEVVEDDSENSTYNVIENYVIKGSPHVGNLRSYFVENIDTGEKDTLISDDAYLNFKIENDGNELVYINKEYFICRFDGVTGNEYCIPNIIYNPSVYESFRWLGDQLILLHEDEDKISIYNSITGERTHLFDYGEDHYFYPDGLNFAKVVENKLLIQADGDALVLDLLDNNISEYHIHDTRYTFNPLIDDRYIITYDFELVDNEYVFANKLIDLRDYTVIDLNYIGRINMGDYAKVIPVGDEYVGVFWNSDNLTDIAFRIDVENTVMTHEPRIQPRTSQGLPGNTTKLLKLGGSNIAFVAEDVSDGVEDQIYSVVGDQVNLIVSDTIYNFYPSGFIELEDKVTYATEKNDHWQIFSFDGINLEQEATFPIPSSPLGTAGFLEDYVITENNVYAVIQGLGFDSGTNLVRYDIIDGTVEEIKELEDLFEVPLATDGENTYFYSEATLFHVDDQGELESIYSVEGTGNVTGALRQSGDHIYFITFAGVFLLDGRETVPLFDEKLDVSLFEISLSSPVGNTKDPLLFDISRDVENTMLYIDGSTMHEVNVGSNSNSITLQNGNYFLVAAGPDQNGPRRFLLYNGSSNELHDLTYLSQGERLLNIHELSDKNYVISYEQFAEILNIYRLSDDFLSVDLVFSSPVTEFTSDPNFKILDGEGMLYTNDFIFQVDQDYQFHELDVVGNASTPEMEIDDDGYIYFIAKDEEFGNQLYRVILVSLRTDVKDIESVEVFKVSPNPANSVITIPIELEGEYFIFNDAGQLMMQGELNNSQLDISRLPAGLHSMQIVSDKKIYVSRVVKINN